MEFRNQKVADHFFQHGYPLLHPMPSCPRRARLFVPRSVFCNGCRLDREPGKAVQHPRQYRVKPCAGDARESQNVTGRWSLNRLVKSPDQPDIGGILASVRVRNGELIVVDSRHGSEVQIGVVGARITIYGLAF